MRSKLIAVILALVLSLSLCAPVFAAGGEDDFTGTWIEPIAHRGIMYITLEEGLYKIRVEWPGSAFEHSVWDLSGTLDEASGVITYRTGTYVVNTYDEDSFKETERRIGLAGTIELRDGKLYWTENGSEEPNVFERMAPPIKFEDVSDSDYFYDAVVWAFLSGITEGRSETAFAPDGTCSRAEAMTFLWRFAGKPETDGASCPFTDLEKGSWYEEPVFWGFANKITDGVSDTAFNPKGTTTRAHVITFLYRAAGEPAVEAEGFPYADVPAGSWYEKPVMWAYANGMLDENNTPEKTLFKPNDPCRRADIVTFMHLAAENGVSASDHTYAYPYQFTGEWQDKVSMRASLTALPREYGNSEAVNITITWAGSAWECFEWTIPASFDEAEGQMVYTDGLLKQLVYDDEGKLSSETVVNEGSSGRFFFKNGEIKWEDSYEERSPEMSFVANRFPAPAAESLLNEYFKAVAGIMPGTAGASLREAEALCAVMKYAENSGLLSADAASLREEMLKAWEMLGEDGQAAFDEAFMGMVSLGDQAGSDYASVSGVFEDAGVGAEMKALMENVHARLCWDVLKANTLTMGNSEE